MHCVLLRLYPAPSAAAVVIGLQESQYTVLFQTSDSQFACVEVLSGDVAGREIILDFSVEDSGKYIQWYQLTFYFLSWWLWPASAVYMCQYLPSACFSLKKRNTSLGMRYRLVGNGF